MQLLLYLYSIEIAQALSQQKPNPALSTKLGLRQESWLKPRIYDNPFSSSSSEMVRRNALSCYLCQVSSEISRYQNTGRASWGNEKIEYLPLFQCWWHRGAGWRVHPECPFLVKQPSGVDNLVTVVSGKEETLTCPKNGWRKPLCYTVSDRGRM